MTEEQQAAADAEAIRADKWAKKMAERDAVKAESDAAREKLGGSAVMHTVTHGDGTKQYSNGSGTRGFYDREPNPFANQPNAKAPGSSADLWNINNGRDRDVNYGERDKTTDRKSVV